MNVVHTFCFVFIERAVNDETECIDIFMNSIDD